MPSGIEQARPPSAPSAAASAAIQREPVENLTAAEMDLLEEICAQLIPTDANGPGAREARAAHYIDRALGGALAASVMGPSGARNPTLTVQALAWRTAEYLARNWRSVSF